MGQEPEVYMPALPASAEEAIGKVPLTPDCTRTTRLVGARQSGWVEVTVGVGVEVIVEDGVAVPMRDCELLGVSERVAELLEVPVTLGVAEELRVSDADPVEERVVAGVCVALEVAVCVEAALPV